MPTFELATKPGSQRPAATRSRRVQGTGYEFGWQVHLDPGDSESHTIFGVEQNWRIDLRGTSLNGNQRQPTAPGLSRKMATSQQT